jgi:hypothetical protein
MMQQATKQQQSRRLAFFFDRLNDVRCQFKRAQLKFQISCLRDDLAARATTIEYLWDTIGKADAAVLLMEEKQRDLQGEVRRLERQLANI